MVHKGTTEHEGIITESLPNTNFRVKLDQEKLVLCHVSGRMRINHIRLMPGDRVRIEMTPYDQNKGRIVYKIK